MKLSKSLYTRGLQCVKSLWLKKYNKKVLTLPDESAQTIFQTGNEVGDLACKLFPNGVEISYENTTFEDKITLTQEYINEGVKNIYETTFQYDGILVMIDILNIENNTVTINEVKSSTSVKDVYIYDASIQYYVLRNLGYDVKEVNIIHINNQYVREKDLDINQLFYIVDVTLEVIDLQENIPMYLSHFEKYLEDKENESKEFLAIEGIDPRYELAKRLVTDIPTDVTVLAYNMGFEKGVIRKLANLYSEFTYDLMCIHDNIKDLMIPFQNKDYFSPKMKGSYSIKYVLPALIPEMEKSYKI